MLTLVVGFAVGCSLVVGKLCDGNLGLSLTAFFFCLIGGVVRSGGEEESICGFGASIYYVHKFFEFLEQF